MEILDEIKKVQAQAELMFSAAEVAAALDKMAVAIAEKLSESNPIALTVMNGGIITAAQLMLRLNFPMQIDSISITRYHSTTQGREIRWLKQPAKSLQNRHVLIIDDILDEGVTLAHIKTYCLEQGAESVHAAVLIDKKLSVDKPARAEVVGLACENRYLFGCGMDYKGYLRNLPAIYACREFDNHGG